STIRTAMATWHQKWNTINGVLGTLDRIFKFAMREFDFKQNPMQRVDRLKRRRDVDEADKVFTAFELKKILAAANPGLEKTLLMVATHTGLRPGEICGLCWDAMDLKAGTVSVKRSLTEISEAKGGPILEDPKNKNAYRVLTLPPEVVTELRHWKLQSQPTAKGHVFTNMFGKPMRKISISCMLTRCCKRAGVKVLPPKSLRHTFASQHVILGTSLPEVSKMLGHHSIGFTLDTYTHWTKE